MRYLFTLLAGLLLATVSVNAQSQNYELSAPVDIPVKEGWNKLIQMRNGNTLLFHLEPRKGIVVKVFDNTHKEIASKKHICEVFDINMLEKTDFKGLYEIGGEAVMFFEQQNFGTTTLHRLRFDATNGKLLEEGIADKARGKELSPSFYVAKDTKTDNYAVLHFKDLITLANQKLSLTVWNEKHEMQKEVTFDLKGGGIMRFWFLGLKYEGPEIYASFGLRTQDSKGVEHKYIVNGQVAQADTLFTTDVFEMHKDMTTLHSFFSYNAFSESENILAVADYRTTIEVGKHKDQFQQYYSFPYFTSFSREGFVRKNLSVIKTDTLRAPLANTIDTFLQNIWLPMEMHTNQYGATLVVYEEQSKDFKYSGTYCNGRIGISILDDEGREISGTIIPKTRSYRKMSPHSNAVQHTSRALFRNYVTNEYYSQFDSYDLVADKATNHIIVNNLAADYDKSIYDTTLIIEKFEYTSAVCYTLNRKRELSKRYLFGMPTKDESTACMLESAWYDESKKVYAAIVLQRKGDKLESRVAWCKLDEAVNNVQ